MRVATGSIVGQENLHFGRTSLRDRTITLRLSSPRAGHDFTARQVSRSLRIASIGSDPMLLRRRRAMSATGSGEDIGEIEHDASVSALQNVDVLFIGTSIGERYQVASKALRCGVHLFLEWPPATSIHECADLTRLAEEAGLECGVSRPLRFNPLFKAVSDGWRAEVTSLTLSGDSFPLDAERTAQRSVRGLMADAVDLACFLAGTTSIQRADAAATNHDAARKAAMLFNLRFHSGACAQGLIRLNGSADPAAIYAFGDGLCLEGFVDVSDEALYREIDAFLKALAEGGAVPVSVFDALQTMRIIERLQAVLR